MNAEKTTLTPEQKFLHLAHAGANLFLTGMAGTGKSYLLRQFIHENDTGQRVGNMELGADRKQIDVTAPTGIAALNVDGMTVNRWAGIMIGPAPGQSNEDFCVELMRDQRKSKLAAIRRVRRVQCLVIDEISMMNGRSFEFLNYWMKYQRGCDKPFGGVQVICIGDFMQLPPVRKSEKEPYDWAFCTNAWAEAGFTQVTLETVRRQEELEFIEALSDFRMGKMHKRSIDDIRERVVLFPPGDITRIFTHNAQVDKWNALKFEEIPGIMETYTAEKMGTEKALEYLTKNLLTPEVLNVKVGARVMFTRNDPRGGFVNGLCGTVEDMCSGVIGVNADKVGWVGVTRQQWVMQTDNEEASFTQFPLRLAYAMTIHKSQGTTLDSAYIDIRAAREPGQAYVAISRVRTRAGLFLKEWPTGVWVSNEAKRFYEKAA